MSTPEPVARMNKQIAFFRPVDDRGKWHAAWLVTHTAICGVPVDLDRTEAIRTHAGQERAKVHPIVCRRCLRLVGPGYSAEGVKR